MPSRDTSSRLWTGLQQVEEKLTAITTAVQAVETQEGGFLEQAGAVRREIEATFQQLMQQLMRELDQVTDNYISACKKEADIIITQLKSCKEFAEEELRIGSQQEILVKKGQMVERMAAVCSLVKAYHMCHSTCGLPWLLHCCWSGSLSWLVTTLL